LLINIVPTKQFYNCIVSTFMKKESEVYMGRKAMNKGQVKIYVDKDIIYRMDKLDEILNRHKHRGVMVISKSSYWEGVIKEHLNSRDVIELLAVGDKKIRHDGYL